MDITVEQAKRAQSLKGEVNIIIIDFLTARYLNIHNLRNTPTKPMLYLCSMLKLSGLFFAFHLGLTQLFTSISKKITVKSPIKTASLRKRIRRLVYAYVF